MRDQGRLIQWFDEKGYGFIQPKDPAKSKVFLHIKDFARPGPRPIVGCALDYEVFLDQAQRYRAKNVIYLKASQTQKLTEVSAQIASSGSKKRSNLEMIALLYLILVGVMSFVGLLPAYVLLVILLANALSYGLYAKDKTAAKQNQPRVAEQTLHLLSFLGGWPMAAWAQRHFKHKTQKQPFRRIYFYTIILNVLLVLWLVSPLNTILH